MSPEKQRPSLAQLAGDLNYPPEDKNGPMIFPNTLAQKEFMEIYAENPVSDAMIGVLRAAGVLKGALPNLASDEPSEAERNKAQQVMDSPEIAGFALVHDEELSVPFWTTVGGYNSGERVNNSDMHGLPSPDIELSSRLEAVKNKEKQYRRQNVDDVVNGLIKTVNRPDKDDVLSRNINDLAKGSSEKPENIYLILALMSAGSPERVAGSHVNLIKMIPDIDDAEKQVISDAVESGFRIRQYSGSVPGAVEGMMKDAKRYGQVGKKNIESALLAVAQGNAAVGGRNTLESKGIVQAFVNNMYAQIEDSYK